jgi:hypothetical protein
MPTALDALALTPAAGVAGTLAQPLSFTVPLLDNDEFTLLKAKRRHEVTVTLRVLERMHALRAEPRFVNAVQTLAAGYQHLGGFSAPSLFRKYAAYVASRGNWRSLVKGYKAPSKQPAAFTEFVRGLIEQNRGCAKAALEMLREEIWPSGAEVPGYGTWQDFFRTHWPHLEVPARFPRVWPVGWSVRNLSRYGPTKAEAKLFSGGIAAAHGNLPKIVRDTSPLRPLELIAIDDFELDVMCKFSGDRERALAPQIAYVGGLMAMCVGTRKHLATLFGPMVEREARQADGTVKRKRDHVKQIDVQALLYTVFREHGLPDYDVTILCENRAATITPAMELMLQTVFGGRIHVKRTSLIEHKTLTNGFVESGGTPWEKGWIESDFHYLWNRVKRLPGYKGSNERLNAPGDLPGMLKHCAKFLGQGEHKLNLPEEIVAELPLPFMNEDHLRAAFDFIVLRAEERTNHRFLGFDNVTDFRWPHPALPAPDGIDPAGPNSFRALALLTREQQALMIPEERKESSRERWERLSLLHPRARVSNAALALFLLAPNKAKWRNHAVTFAVNKVGYSYVDVDGVLPPDLAEGTELLAYVDFNEPGAAVVCTLDGTQLGVLRMLGGSPRGADITDPEAVAQARAQRAEIVNRVLARVRARPLHQASNAQLGADKARCEEIVAAYQAETAQLPLAEQLAAAIGEKRALAQQEAKAVHAVDPAALLARRAAAATAEHSTVPAADSGDWT